MESKGVIEESKSLWLNPVVLVRKKTGSLRFCVDLRRVNDLVDLDSFDIPIIRETVKSLYGMEYFSLLDLQDGYFQVPIHNEDREKTAFLDGSNRLMQFRRLPQGFKNAPSLFQRGMTLVLRGLINSRCIVYIDDILIFGRSLEEHDKNLAIVKSRLQEYGLSVNKEKSVIGKTEISFLGFRLSKNKVQPSMERSSGITNFPLPTTKRQMRKFLGLLNYDREFVAKLSDKTKPLYKALNDNSKSLKLEDTDVKRFKEIKNIWSKDLELRTPCPDAKYSLETDASGIGIGAVLRQDDKIIANISRVLKGSELNYGITDREVLAAIWSMEKLEYYLVGNQFDLITDHKAIEHINSKPEFGSRRVQRWRERFERFNFRVIYREGSKMVMADTLSRNIEDVDDEFEKVMKIHVEFNHRKTILPHLKKEGFNISQKKLTEYLESCIKCAENYNKNVKSANFYVTKEPGEVLSIDTMSVDKRYSVVLAIDYFSRYAWGICLSSKHSEKIFEFVKDVYKEIKFKTLLSDNGKEFDNTLVNDWCKDMKINRKFSIPYYHQGNGRIERLNRTIRDSLKKGTGNMRVRVKKALEKYNQSTHRATGLSPREGLLEENRQQILDTSKKYAKEFKKK